MEVANYNSERLFAIELKSMKLRIIFGVKKMNNLTIVVRGVGLKLYVFLRSLTVKTVFTDDFYE